MIRYPDLRFIEAWLEETNTSASALSTIACGSPNYISMMRSGSKIREKHVKAMLEYVRNHPEGIKRPKRIYTGRPRKKKNTDNERGAGGPQCTSIPVLGPSSMSDMDMFYHIKCEAIQRGVSIAHLMESLLKMGWEQYIQKKAA